MANCDWAEPRLGAWFDGELEASEARRVMAHVERCTACDRRRRLLVGASALLRQLGRAEELPAPRIAPRRARRWTWGLAAAAIVAVGLGAAYVQGLRARPAIANDCGHCGPEPFPRPPRVDDVAHKR